MPLAVQAVATIYRTSIATVFSLVAIDSLGSELNAYSAGIISGHLSTVKPELHRFELHESINMRIDKQISYLELCSLCYRMYKVYIRNTCCNLLWHSALCYNGLVLHMYFCFIIFTLVLLSVQF